MENITLNKICKSYGGKTVLTELSHTFPAGETTVIMGPSGCGKTTLLNLLLGLEKPDSGEITGLGSVRKSAIFQEDRLCENVGAVSNLRLASPRLSRKDAEKVLRDLGLSDALRQPVKEFSGGMKRRVAILRALCAEYDVLLADEPFQGLDEALKRQTMEYFRNHTQGRTVILVTHVEEEAQFFAGELWRL